MADQYPDYKKIKEIALAEYLTDGPNSGGAAGLLLTKQKVYYFDATDWVGKIYKEEENITFFKKHQDSRQRGYADVIQHMIKTFGYKRDNDAPTSA